MDNAASRPDEPIDLSAAPELERAGLRIQPQTRMLHGPAGSALLEPRVMQVLLALVGKAGGVVSRDGLLAAGWGRTVVGDDALNRAVGGVRRALRQVGAEGWQLETIPRVGYRLLEPAVASPQAPAAPMAEPDLRPTPVADAAGRRPARRLWVLAGAAAAVVSVAGLAAMRRNRAHDEALALMAQAREDLRLAAAPADRRAADALGQAVERAPDHAPAWGLLALAQRAVAEAAPPPQLPGALAAVEVAAARALELDARQADALLARAMLIPAFGQWAAVEAALRAVLDIDPDHLPTLDVLGLLLSSTGVIAAHYPLRLKTVKGDPLHAGYNFRSIYSHWMNGHLAAADQAGERGLELWPGHVPTWLARTSLLAYTGRADRALTLLETATAALPPPLRQRQRVAWTALASGRPSDRAAARAATLAGLEQAGPLLAVGATLDLAALGELDLALDVTEAFLLERGPVRAATSWRPGQPWHMDVRRRFTNHLFLPVTEPLRQHPRFEALMRDIGMVAHWQRSGRWPDYRTRGAG